MHIWHPNGLPNDRHNRGRWLMGQKSSGVLQPRMEVGGVLPMLKMVGTQRIAEEGWFFIDSRF